MVLTIEGNINDRLASTRHLIEKLAPLREMRSGDARTLDLSNMRYIGPDGVAFIAGSILEARGRGIVVDLKLPTAPAALVAFLSFSGFAHLFCGARSPDPLHPENVTVAMRQFHRSRHTDPEPIVQLIKQFEPLSEDLQLSLEISVNEVIQNIEDHSRSPVGGFGCARWMKTAREVRVALVDWGEGILTSLRRRHPDTRDELHALERVLYGGYSAKSRPNNAGRGIDNLRLVVTGAAAGSLYIVSGAGAVDVRGHRKPRYERLQYPFQGTVVCFTLPVRS